MPGCIVDMEIGLLFEPPPCSGPEVLEVLKVSSAEQIPFYILKRRLNFPFGAVRQLHKVTNLRRNFFG